MGSAIITNNAEAPPLTLEQQNTNNNALILANAGEFAVGIISAIAGNDISTAINGSKATAEIMMSLLYRRISARLASNTEGRRI